MKTLFVLIITLFTITLNAQSLAETTGQEGSLYNALAITAGYDLNTISYTIYPVDSFRKDATAYAKTVGMKYDKSGKMNLAILHAQTNQVGVVPTYSTQDTAEHAPQETSQDTFNKVINGFNISVIADNVTDVIVDTPVHNLQPLTGKVDTVYIQKVETIEKEVYIVDTVKQDFCDCNRTDEELIKMYYKVREEVDYLKKNGGKKYKNVSAHHNLSMQKLCMYKIRRLLPNPRILNIDLKEVKLASLKKDKKSKSKKRTKRFKFKKTRGKSANAGRSRRACKKYAKR